MPPHAIRAASPVTRKHRSKPDDHATLSGNQRPDLLMAMSLVPRLPHEMHLCRSSSNVPRMPSFLKPRQNPQVWLTYMKP